MIFEEFTDLAALGIVSDMMDIRNLDNNYIISKGLKKYKPNCTRGKDSSFHN